MKRHLDDEFAKLNRKLMKMGLLVQDAVMKCSKSLLDRDSSLATAVIKDDKDINLCEIEIDELAYELVARFQPTAGDLRLIIMTLKANNDLERMGDQSVNIAQKALIANGEVPLISYDPLKRLSEHVLFMIREALSSYVDGNVEQAASILEMDDTADQLDDEITEMVQTALRTKPECVEAGISLITISHNFERLADLATNIAEDVIFFKKGVDVRHHILERRSTDE